MQSTTRTVYTSISCPLSFTTASTTATKYQANEKLPFTRLPDGKGHRHLTRVLERDSPQPEVPQTVSADPQVLHLAGQEVPAQFGRVQAVVQVGADGPFHVLDLPEERTIN